MSIYRSISAMGNDTANIQLPYNPIPLSQPHPTILSPCHNPTMQSCPPVSTTLQSCPPVSTTLQSCPPVSTTLQSCPPDSSPPSHPPPLPYPRPPLLTPHHPTPPHIAPPIHNSQHTTSPHSTRPSTSPPPLFIPFPLPSPPTLPNPPPHSPPLTPPLPSCPPLSNPPCNPVPLSHHDTRKESGRAAHRHSPAPIAPCSPVLPPDRNLHTCTQLPQELPDCRLELEVGPLADRLIVVPDRDIYLGLPVLQVTIRVAILHPHPRHTPPDSIL